ncbi:lysophospholipid acyltransferase family protein [Ketogulonicigenium vulgare]|uniref:Acyltransferase family protein n=1 Tax=Ketogulonicigenium vulgare (strain WSH-001) TaxID=759362 RepID=F9Y8H4_KETVW|nr:lysophospholipid acyltransferase family protein [Ketogulonicigenium vulgare]ADO41750.1 acyltransferase family protein [Ketogulonicigenium vulgare Y25]AEM39983.1 Acyltransferase family protein [Ketogulonicigenium vulgare WSH-001]ALJ80190.1 glycerol acyltransferase [Ketogulonicigenium vulgare]ANW33052.1 glycerol acyltransferase [Ketogulonicigenium vulgare]AOZ53681.1 acyltransferase family protein [Ketogulonicigenium vulgare]
MKTIILWLRSALFQVLMYGGMAVVGIVFAPWALFSNKGAIAGARAFANYTRWALAFAAGIKTEIRGEIPQGEILLGSKHESFMDIIMQLSVLPRPKFVMKRELLYTPIVGQYALRLGCIPVDRGKGRQAIRKMKEEVISGRADPGQLIIYPQGTRVAPGEKRPYKGGIVTLYQEMGTACVPVAVNHGTFWPKRSFLRYPGTAVMEFLPAIPAGLEGADMLKQLETAVETASANLRAEAARARD